MNVLKKNNNFLWFSYLFTLVFLFIGFAHSAQAQSTTKEEHLNMLMDRWVSQNPVDAKALEKAKKDAEKLEKDFKDYSDKAFQNSFDTVFNGKLKPSAAIDYLKVFEAVSAGDIEEAGKLTTDLAIAAYAPGLGHYITAMKLFHGKIKKQVTSWGNEVYQTDTFKFFRYDLAHMTKLDAMEARDLRYPVYVPSYMVNKFRKDKYIGKEMDILYEAMVSFEGALFQQWSEGDEPREFALQFGDLKKKPWWDFGSTGGKNSQWIVALGADPSEFGKLSVEQKMFNFFLYEMTAQKREEYMSDLSLFYIQPLIKREARIEQKRLDDAIKAAVHASIAAINQAVEQEKKDKKQAEDLNQQALWVQYRKYLDNGLANNTIYLPIDMTPDQAFQIGLQAVERKENYYKAIDRLTALALKQAEEREQAEQAQNGQEDPEDITDLEMQEEIPVVDEAWLEEEEESFETDTSQPLVQVDTLTPTPRPLVTKARRECLMSYDFSGHKQAGILALLPSNLQSDPEGENVKYMLGLIGETCKPGYTAPVSDTDDGDDWADVDEDLTVSYVTEEEKWAMRDELSAKREADAAQSDERYNQQYASIEAQREEEAQQAAARAAAFGSFMQDLAVGVAQVADQIETENRAFDAQLQQNNNNMNNVFVKANKRDKFMRSCMNNRPSTPGFASSDPNGGRIACGQNYRAKISGTSGNGNTYDEQLKAQQAQTARRRAEEQRKLIAERKANAKKARDRVYAQAQCSCYQAGKSSGRQHSSMENSDSSQYDSSKRPSNCERHIMGPMTPWLGGYYDGKAGNDNYSWVSTYGKTIKWCRSSG